MKIRLYNHSETLIDLEEMEAVRSPNTMGVGFVTKGNRPNETYIYYENHLIDSDSYKISKLIPLTFERNGSIP